MKIRPIILSGGSGTRLWPVSRKNHPKQFAELMGDQALLSATLKLAQGSSSFLPPAIIANEGHKFFVLEAVAKNAVDGVAIILEPCGRNTAGAALTAALAEKDEGVLHLLMPSDHVIRDPKAFFAAVEAAAKAAAQARITLFGIKPQYPETGYGYIRRGEKTAWAQVDQIKNFKEKPDVATAEALIQEGALWNSGIFLYDPTALVGEVRNIAADQIELCQAALDNASTDLGCKVLDKASYAALRDISFDYLVMENTQSGAVVACDMGWSDVGSWQAMWQIEAKDKNSNVVQGPVTAVDVQDSYLRSEHPAVGVIGVKDIAVVATKDAVLVMPRARSQDVKQLVAELEGQNANVASAHSRVMRPWGSYEGVAQGQRFQVKHIVVRPGQSLSLQMHHHRAEHWIIVAGTALVECDGEQKRLHENESTFIPKGSKHRLSNPGKVDLHLVEVQSGEYLGEDDIVRFEDNYGRTQAKVIKLS